MKITRTTVLFMLIAAFQAAASAQTTLLNDIQNHITINHDDGAKEVFEVSTKTVKTKPQFLYHWYASQQIHRTQGGYSGKLLDGAYSFYYSNKQLARQGKYRKGLANGDWKMWYENHRLAKLETWKRGSLTGSASDYDKQGKLTLHGKKKDGEWQGKVYTWVSADSSYQWMYYDRGKSISRDAYVDQSIFRRTGRFFNTLWHKIFHEKKKESVTLAPEQ